MSIEEKFEEWKKDCSEKLKTFEILSDFEGMSKKMTFKCLICGHIFEKTPYEFKRKKTRGCKICDNNIRRRDRQDFLQSVKEKNKHYNDIIIGEYVSKRTKIEVTCKLCGRKHYYLPIALEAGCWCPDCKSGRLKTKEQFEQDLYKIHGKNISLKGDYIDDSTKTAFLCNKCGNEWEQKPRAILNGHGCPKCKMKHLERQIQFLLRFDNVEFQKNFPWLSYKGRMFLDFYLPDKNIAIECQGKQHFQPVDFAGKGCDWAEENFEANLARDKQKKELCEEHGIKILYFTSKKQEEKIDITDKKYNGVYTKQNLFSNIDDLKKLIL